MSQERKPLQSTFGTRSGNGVITVQVAVATTSAQDAEDDEADAEQEDQAERGDDGDFHAEGEVAGLRGGV